MKVRTRTQTITVASPDAAGTVIHTEMFRNFPRADVVQIDAVLSGATGGYLDVVLQRRVAVDSWIDLCRFVRLAAGSAAKRFSFTIDGSGLGPGGVRIFEVGGGSDASPDIALTVSNSTNTTPGDALRLILVAGAGTSAGASQSITLTAYEERFF